MRVALAAGVFIFLVAEMMPVGLMPQIAADLDTTPAQVGGLVAWYALIAGVTGLPVAAACRRLPSRTVVTGAMLILAVAQLVVAIAPNLGTAIAARGFAALAHVTLWSLAPLIAAELAPADQRGRAAGQVFLGSSLALLAGVPALTTIGQHFGWRFATVLVGAAAFVVAVALWKVLPARSGGPATNAAKSSSHWMRASASAGIRVVAPTVLVVTGLYVIYPYLSQFAGERGINGGGYSLLLLAFGAVGIVGVWAVSKRIDKHPGQMSALVVVLVGVLPLAAFGLASFGTASFGAGAFVVTIIAWGFPVAATAVVLQTLVVRIGGVHATVLSSAYVTAYQVGIVAGTWIGGLTLADSNLAAWICLGLAAAGLPFVVSRRASVTKPTLPA